jgi:hypothetical protein
VDLRRLVRFLGVELLAAKHDWLEQVWGWSQVGGGLLALVALVFAWLSVRQARAAAREAEATAKTAQAGIDLAREELDLLKSRGQAELIAEWHEILLYVGADDEPEGRELALQVGLRNTGGSKAYHPYFWFVDADGQQVHPMIALDETASLDPGEFCTIERKLPQASEGDLEVWIGWQDIRGRQERATSITIESPPKEPSVLSLRPR